MFDLFAPLALAAALFAGAGQTATPPAQPAVPDHAPAAAAPAEDPAITALALKIYGQMRAGKIDNSLFTQQMIDQLSPANLAQVAPIFTQLGDPTKLTLVSKQDMQGGTNYVYAAQFSKALLHITIFLNAQGKIGGYFVRP